MVDLTARFLRSLREKNEVIMVPAPVAAEYLQGFSDEARAEQMAALDRYFFVPSFDLRAAELAAQLSRRTEVQELYEQGDRHRVKTDVQIVAIAITQGADLIVTDNVKEYRAIAGGRITISEVPSVEEQPSLYE